MVGRNNISRFVSLIAALGFFAAPLVGQAPDRGWSARFTWAASAFSLDEGTNPEWRPAMGVRVELGVSTHLQFEVAATGPLSTRQGTACLEVVAGCQATAERPGFTLLTGALNAHADVGRLRPFVGIGGGRIWVNDLDPSGLWLLVGGMDWRVAGPFGLGFDYRASRTHWSFGETGVNQELSLRMTVDVLGAG